MNKRKVKKLKRDNEGRQRAGGQMDSYTTQNEKQKKGKCCK